MASIDLRERIRTSVLDVRGDGKAGGGLVLAFQSLANLMLRDSGLHVQEWPFFSSARRGANIRSFLRVGSKPILAACEVTRPALSVLMDEGASRSVDFTQGVPPGGTFVLNTPHTPEECARHYGLVGRVITVDGDKIGTEHLKATIGNVSIYVATARAIGGFEDQAIVESFLETLGKRHVPAAVVERNKHALKASLEAVTEGVFEEAVQQKHAAAPWRGYGYLPVGAQTALRLSAANQTANYAPTGLRLRFEDPKTACNGCAHCITNCPEGIIHFVPDAERGLLVTGVDVSTFCKLCGECIAVCPEHLFQEVPYEEPWLEVIPS
jgi:2-oxoacid:acceptor oxidoreductase gamma subunit (pyruvate/2-ketoisovalerate family)